MKSVADRLIWRPPLMRAAAIPRTEKIVSGRFRDVPPGLSPGDWMVNTSPRARRAYRVIEIGEEGRNGYRRIMMESHPADAVPDDAKTFTFYRDKR